MDAGGTAPSQTSECSSVLDLSCTYNISDRVLQQEPPPGTWEEDVSLDISPASSLPSQNNTGFATNWEDNEQFQTEDDQKSVRLSHSRDTFQVSDQNSLNVTPSPNLENKGCLSDGKIRASLDAFYERSCQADDCHHLSEKISDLRKKNHLYAQRSFQLAKIVLNQGGTNVLQDCPGTKVFNSSEETKSTINIKPVPGLSTDVIRFIMARRKT